MTSVEAKAQDILAPLLADGEALLWAQSVDFRAYARASFPRFLLALGLLASGALVLSLTVAVAITAPDAGIILPALLPVLLGAAGLLAAAHQFAIVRRGRDTAYGVTDRRCIAATGGPKQARVSLLLSRVTGLHVDGGGDRGSITLTAASPAAGAASLAFSLLSIRHPRQLELLLLDLIAPRKETP